MIILAKRLGGTSVTTLNDALYYLNVTNSQTLALNKDYENYLPGMGLCYDFTYTPSYPRSGTTVNDLSTENGATRNTGTLTSTPPSYSDTDFGGYVSFPGSQSVTLNSTITPGNNTAFAFVAIVRPDAFDSGSGTIISNNSGGPVTSAYGTYGGRISYDYYNGSWQRLGGTSTLNAGEWVHLLWTQASSGEMALYVNGIQEANQATSTTNGGPVDVIGKNWFAYFNGAIAKVSYYTSTISPGRAFGHYLMGEIFIDTANSILPTRVYDVANPVCNIQTSTVYNLMTPLTGAMTLNPDSSLVTSNSFGGCLTVSPSNGVSSASEVATGAYTVCFWMKYNGSPTSAKFFTLEDSSTPALLYGSMDTTGRITLQLGDNLSNVASITSVTPVGDGFWHHVVLSYINDAPQMELLNPYHLDRGIYLYVDGKLEASDPISSLSSANWSLEGTMAFINHNANLGPIQTYDGFAFREQEARQNYYSAYFRYNN